MPNDESKPKTSPASEGRASKIQRELPMPKYDYQTPRTGSFVVRYEDQKERQKKAERDKAPSLHNLRYVRA